MLDRTQLFSVACNGFGVVVDYHGRQSIRRTGAVLNVLQGEEGASTNGKTHSRAVEPYRTGALFTRRRRRLYYSENVYHDARAADSSKVIKYRI